ncbi:hypothetical protein D3C73_1474110 [compost metagenome]
MSQVIPYLMVLINLRPFDVQSCFNGWPCRHAFQAIMMKRTCPLKMIIWMTLHSNMAHFGMAKTLQKLSVYDGAATNTRSDSQIKHIILAFTRPFSCFA